MSTTVTTLLPAILQPMSNLPNELIEKILTSLPVSAVIELSIAEDRMRSDAGVNIGIANGFFSTRILGSPGWKAVFGDRQALIDLRQSFDMIVGSYELVYRRKFSHAYVQRKDWTDKGVKEHAFRRLRRLLSMHTRFLGPWHQELLWLRSELDEQHHRFVRELWCSMEPDWPFYMAHLPRSMGNKTDVEVPSEWRLDWIRNAKSPPSDLRLKRLKFMVTVQRHYKDPLSKELRQLSSLMDQHPHRLKQLRDGREQPRWNTRHITHRLALDSNLISHLPFASRRMNAGRSRFNDDRLPLVPLDKWMWFFLECRSNLIKLGSVSPPEVTKDMDTVMSFISQVVDDPGRLTPRLVTNSQDRYVAAKIPSLPSLDELEDSLDSGGCLRPIFTSPHKSSERDIKPHSKGEMEWLEAFLRCCDYFTDQFPNLLEKVEAEAMQSYLPCALAEERHERHYLKFAEKRRESGQEHEDRRKREEGSSRSEEEKRRKEMHIAAELSLKGAKYEMLSR